MELYISFRASISTVFHIFHPVHLCVCFHCGVENWWKGTHLVEKVKRVKRVKKRKQWPQNSKNMFFVACHEGKMLYLRSL